MARQHLVRHANRAGVALKETYERECKALRRLAGGYAYAKQFMCLKAVFKLKRTIQGVLIRDVTRKGGAAILLHNVI